MGVILGTAESKSSDVRTPVTVIAAETGESRVPGCPLLHAELENSMGCIRPCIRKSDKISEVVDRGGRLSGLACFLS